MAPETLTIFTGAPKADLSVFVTANGDGLHYTGQRASDTITRDDREILRTLDVIDNCQPGRNLITWVGAGPP